MEGRETGGAPDKPGKHWRVPVHGFDAAHRRGALQKKISLHLERKLNLTDLSNDRARRSQKQWGDKTHLHRPEGQLLAAQAEFVLDGEPVPFDGAGLPTDSPRH